MQNHYNLIYREEEREMFPTLKVLHLTFFFHGFNELTFCCSTWMLGQFHGPLLVVAF